MTDRPPSGTTRTDVARGVRTEFLGIYLNDHLAGATVGTERARYLVKANRGTPIASAMEPIAAEIAQDRASLVDLMRQLDVPIRQYKIHAGWLAEKAGRLKSNGRLLRRSPLSSYVELEALRLGVEGKAACWQVLRLVTSGDERLDRRLDDLLERAGRQRATLEELRLQQASTTFRT